MQMQDIFYTFPNVTLGTTQTVYSVALDQLDQYFNPQVNVPFERHLFRNISQQPSETIDQLITRLRQKAEFCDFIDVNGQMRDQVIEKCLSHNLRRKLLQKGRNLTLDQLQTVARAMETSENQAVSIEGTTPRGEQVNRVHQTSKRRSDSDRQTGNRKQCYRCGSNAHLQKSDSCSAKDKECFKCHKIGHFSKMCKTKPEAYQGTPKHKRKTPSKQKVRLVETSDDDYAFSIGDDCKQPTVPVSIGGIHDVPMIIDSGSSCNVISKQLWENLKTKHVDCVSGKSEKKLYVYGSEKSMDVMGCFVAQVSVGNNGRSISAEFTVVKGKGQALLGYKTATELGVLKIGVNNVNTVQQLVPDEQVEKYKSCFSGLGIN
ncbi:uncharacterized protein [Argopecten irradians]|uniref:uncharacterized protein n=1 Tax=Argopecten irradians TaxID=31199 RepID=UPI00371A8CF3